MENRGRAIVHTICGVLILLSILAVLTLGIIKNMWHPYWFMIPATVIVSAIVELVANLFIKPTSLNDSTK